MTIQRSILVSLGVLLATVPGTARPCSPSLPTCETGTVAPAGHTPVNFPGFRLFSGTSCTGDLQAMMEEPVLLTEGGRRVATERAGDWLLPKRRLKVGERYQVRWEETCWEDRACSWDGTPVEREAVQVAVELLVQPEAPPPTVFGRVVLADQRLRTLLTPKDVPDASCSDGLLANVALLAIEPSEELLPWLPLTRFEVSVDGRSQGTTAYGSTSAHALWNGMGPLPDDDALVLTKVCDPDIARDLEPVTRQVRVEAQVLDGSRVAGILEVELGCDPEHDRGALATLEAIEPAEPFTYDGGGLTAGCRCTGGSTGDGLALGLLALVLSAAGGRRRRGR